MKRALDVMKSRRGWCSLLLVGLVFFGSAAVAGQTMQVGDWYYSTNGDTSEAYTVSSTGATFGLLCSHSLNSCEFYLRSTSVCDAGQSYPILENSDAGAANLTATCRTITTPSGSIYAFVLSPMTTVESSLKGSGLFGFAEPMQGGAFRVYRFSANGAMTSTAAVANYAAQAVGDQVQ